MAGSARIITYWGNEHTDRSPGTEEGLAYYCEEDYADTIVIQSALALAGSSVRLGGHCTAVNGEGKQMCPQVGKDIKECSRLHKSVYMTLTNELDGEYQQTLGRVGMLDVVLEEYVTRLLDTYGFKYDLTSTHYRPFGDALVNGFVFDRALARAPYAAQLAETISHKRPSMHLLFEADCDSPELRDHNLLQDIFEAVIVRFSESDKKCNIKDEGFNWAKWAKYPHAGEDFEVYVGLDGGPSKNGGVVVDSNFLRGKLPVFRKSQVFAGFAVDDAYSAEMNGDFLSKISDITELATPASDSR